MLGKVQDREPERPELQQVHHKVAQGAQLPSDARAVAQLRVPSHTELPLDLEVALDGLQRHPELGHGARDELAQPQPALAHLVIACEGIVVVDGKGHLLIWIEVGDRAARCARAEEARDQRELLLGPERKRLLPTREQCVGLGRCSPPARAKLKHHVRVGRFLLRTHHGERTLVHRGQVGGRGDRELDSGARHLELARLDLPRDDGHRLRHELRHGHRAGPHGHRAGPHPASPHPHATTLHHHTLPHALHPRPHARRPIAGHVELTLPLELIDERIGAIDLRIDEIIPD